MPGQIVIDIKALDAAVAQLTPAKVQKAVSRFRKALASLLRQRALPDIRSASPRRTGRLRKGWRVKSQAGRVAVTNQTSYWHLQTAPDGTPLPQLVDRTVLAVVNDEGADLLADIVVDIIGERADRTTRLEDFRLPF